MPKLQALLARWHRRLLPVLSKQTQHMLKVTNQGRARTLWFAARRTGHTITQQQQLGLLRLGRVSQKLEFPVMTRLLHTLKPSPSPSCSRHHLSRACMVVSQLQHKPCWLLKLPIRLQPTLRFSRRHARWPSMYCL